MKKARTLEEFERGLFVALAAEKWLNIHRPPLEALFKLHADVVLVNSVCLGDLYKLREVKETHIKLLVKLSSPKGGNVSLEVLESLRLRSYLLTNDWFEVRVAEVTERERTRYQLWQRTHTTCLYGLRLYDALKPKKLGEKWIV